jgi:hypothetical protein
MFPARSIVIGAYVILRCLEICTRPFSAFSSVRTQAIMIVLSVVVIGLTAYELLAILAVASNAGSSFQDLQRLGR